MNSNILKKASLATLLLGAFLTTSCELIEHHPYEAEFRGESNLIAKNIARLKNERLGDSFRFAFISDTQRWYDDTDDAVDDINKRTDIDFTLHGGDLTDFGLTEEFEYMRDCLIKLREPWLTVIGNHDFLGHGEHIYNKMFGEYNYSFTVGHIRFEAINTVALELDYSTPVPDFEFLEKEIHYIEETNASYPDSIQRTIFVMHSRPGDEQFNNNVLRPFERYLEYFPKPVCFCGHNHKTETISPFNNGILFYGISEIHSRQYYIVTIKGNDYEIETIDF